MPSRNTNMLNVSKQRATPCVGPNRRDLLRIGALSNSLSFPGYGSVVSRERGWQNGLPPYVVLTGKTAPYMGAGYLSSAFNPLTIKADPNEPKFAVQDVSIPDVVGGERTSRRRSMLADLDQWQRLTDRKLEPLVDRDRFYQQAYDLVTSSSAKRAFQLDEEPAAVRDRYGRH